MKHDLKVVENVIAKSLLVSLLMLYKFSSWLTLAGDCISVFDGDAYYFKSVWLVTFFGSCCINNANNLHFRLNPMKAATVLG